MELATRTRAIDIISKKITHGKRARAFRKFQAAVDGLDPTGTRELISKLEHSTPGELSRILENMIREKGGSKQLEESNPELRDMLHTILKIRGNHELFARRLISAITARGLPQYRGKGNEIAARKAICSALGTEDGQKRIAIVWAAITAQSVRDLENRVREILLSDIKGRNMPGGTTGVKGLSEVTNFKRDEILFLMNTLHLSAEAIEKFADGNSSIAKHVEQNVRRIGRLKGPEIADAVELVADRFADGGGSRNMKKLRRLHPGVKNINAGLTKALRAVADAAAEIRFTPTKMARAKPRAVPIEVCEAIINDTIQVR